MPADVLTIDDGGPSSSAQTQTVGQTAEECPWRIGDVAHRDLDGLQFLCQIVTVSPTQKECDVVYLDDRNLEGGVPWDDLVPCDPCAVYERIARVMKSRPSSAKPQQGGKGGSSPGRRTETKEEDGGGGSSSSSSAARVGGSSSSLQEGGSEGEGGARRESTDSSGSGASSQDSTGDVRLFSVDELLELAATGGGGAPEGPNGGCEIGETSGAPHPSTRLKRESPGRGTGAETQLEGGGADLEGVEREGGGSWLEVRMERKGKFVAADGTTIIVHEDLTVSC
uniref:Uncharacterized protein n=1 Tax=Chromera velia CCMP2878 TaxID=1169474 RepID=A0A0G4I857_9ALVE|eukprot:Cvel_1955.t1-p1 / transcript=Cvel_1955.t1 / gene=Cvel_1955 / organism=Chromera_velia_CCMP2878 / gene_product=hypothetical protein / transcript_product=hypothetical protein / location=Cvel_scaffold74:29716-31141(-) / protein_length=281 / sequence_SO=supercontig / SO=protein_coding / is_pseudo=false